MFRTGIGRRSLSSPACAAAHVAPFMLDGPMNATSFMAYLKRCLVPTLKRGDIVMMDSLPVHKVAVCERRLKRPVRDYVTSPNIRRTSIRLSRRSANLKRICESQPSEPFRVSRAGSVPSWPHSVRKNVPITSDMQATLLHDRNPLYRAGTLHRRSSRPPASSACAAMRDEPPNRRRHSNRQTTGH